MPVVTLLLASVIQESNEHTTKNTNVLSSTLLITHHHLGTFDKSHVKENYIFSLYTPTQEEANKHDALESSSIF